MIVRKFRRRHQAGVKESVDCFCGRCQNLSKSLRDWLGNYEVSGIKVGYWFVTRFTAQEPIPILDFDTFDLTR